MNKIFFANPIFSRRLFLKNAALATASAVAAALAPRNFLASAQLCAADGDAGNDAGAGNAAGDAEAPVGLVGSFYDIKQPDGRFEDPGCENYVKFVREFVASGDIGGAWNEQLLQRFYKAQVQLALQQFLIPLKGGNAAAAPAAFGAPEVKPSRWIAHYKGAVAAPFSGRIRFVGMADDWIAVRWAGENKLLAGYSESLPGTYTETAGSSALKSKTAATGSNALKSKTTAKCCASRTAARTAARTSSRTSSRTAAAGTANPDGIGDRYPYGGGRPDFYTGPWFDVTEGEVYDIELATGETPGGEFCGALAFQVENRESPLYLFRMKDGEILKCITDGSLGSIPENVKLDGGDDRGLWIWKPVNKEDPTTTGTGTGTGTATGNAAGTPPLIL